MSAVEALQWEGASSIAIFKRKYIYVHILLDMTFSLNINNICMYNISLYLSYALILNIFNSHFVAPLDGHRSGCPGCQHSISKSYTSLNRSHLSLRRICLRCKAHTYMYFLRFIFFFFHSMSPFNGNNSLLTHKEVGCTWGETEDAPQLKETILPLPFF